MEKIRTIINRFGVFTFWIVLAIFCLAGLICCISQAIAKIAVFLSVCGSIGCGFALLIFAWQAFGEWTERNNYD